ncbi:MAG: acylneuraminate cytidylyltransferase family protein [Rickettsiales bacterium]|nr:acylneuraminate cytidylyltransferase family protein [Rickettsiales bacterium]
MHVVAVIPARGGSKGIPKKNIVPLGGKPLIQWTIDAARKASRLSEVIVSTDSEEIADISRQAGAAIPFMRPAEFASDTASGLDVMRHVIRFYEKVKPIDILVYLQPTSPFRSSAHVDEAVRLLQESDADGVVSVVRVPHNMLPECQMAIAEGGALQPLSGNTPLDRHGKRELYARNGPAVLALKASYIMNCTSLYAGKILPLVMDTLESIDVDDAKDLLLAETLIKHGIGSTR